MKLQTRNGSILRGTCAGAILLLTAAINAQAQYEYTTLNVPGSSTTWASGISGDNVVGYYLPSSGIISGYLYNGGTYTTFSYPGAYQTFANGISGNTIAGYCSLTTGVICGFLYNNGVFTTLSVPGAYETEVFGISGNNVVGQCYGPNGRQAFLYNGSTYSILTGFGSSFVPYAISGNNVLGDSGNASMLYNGSTYTPVSFPGSSFTRAYGLDGNNIVGYESDLDGFLFNGSTYTTFDVPGASGTYPFGVDGNNIVGDYTLPNNGDLLGFIATPVPVPEPSALALLVVGAAVVTLVRLRSKRA